jgi:hypothetical protein
MQVFDWSPCAAVGQAPGKVSGAWLFKNTPVPVRTVIESRAGKEDRGAGICYGSESRTR